MNVCASIQYDGVHSDVCVGHNMTEFTVTDEQRSLLHACLDEWLDRSDGDGHFVVANSDQWALRAVDGGPVDGGF